MICALDLTAQGDGTARQNRNTYLVLSRSRPTSPPPMPLPFSVPQTLRPHMNSCPTTSVYAMPQEHNTRALVRVCILPRAWLVIYIDGHIRTTCAHTLEYTRTHACRIHGLSSDLLPFPHHLLFSRPSLHCIYSQNVVFPSLRLELRMCPASFLLCQGAIWKLQVCACVHTCINTHA